MAISVPSMRTMMKCLVSKKNKRLQHAPCYTSNAIQLPFTQYSVMDTSPCEPLTRCSVGQLTISTSLMLLNDATEIPTKTLTGLP